MRIAVQTLPPVSVCAEAPAAGNNNTIWSYDEAFSRNQGVLTPEEQEKLRHSCVAIAGMGGVGGVHLIALARLGIGKFRIADPDTFETVNFNRQYGARVDTLGKSKVEVMAAEARAINPEIEIEIFKEGVTEENIGAFLDGADLFLDGLDFFVIPMRRRLFQEARKRGLWAMTAGPYAFGTAWVLFSPDGMTFDEYYDMNDNMSEDELRIAFAIGCIPKMLQWAYVDPARYYRPEKNYGASVSAGVFLAAGVMASQAAKALLGRKGMHAAPWYFQFDAYLGKLARGRLWFGNRGPWQRFKRWRFLRRMKKRSAKHDDVRRS